MKLAIDSINGLRIEIDTADTNGSVMFVNIYANNPEESPTLIGRIEISVNSGIGTIEYVKRLNPMFPGAISKSFNNILSMLDIHTLISGLDRIPEVEDMWSNLRPENGLLKFKAKLKPEYIPQIGDHDFHWILTKSADKMVKFFEGTNKYTFIKPIKN